MISRRGENQAYVAILGLNGKAIFDHFPRPSLFLFGRSTGSYCLIIYSLFCFSCAPSHKQGQTNAQALVDLADVSESNDLVVLLDSASLDAGRSKYDQFCTQCHGQLGAGLIGPNLTDAYWIHGNEMTDVIRIIKDGVPEKGMLAWAKILSAKEILEVASYVMSLSGTNVPNAKGPEGKSYTSDGMDSTDEVLEAPIDAALAGLPLTGDAEKGQKLFNGTFGCAHCHGQDISNVSDNRDLKRMQKRYGQGAGLVFDLVTKEGRNGTAMPPWQHVNEEDLIDMKTFIFSQQLVE